MRVAVGKHDVRAQFPWKVRQAEIEKEYAIDSFQVEFPIHAFLALASDGLRKVIQCPFTEIDMLFVLHLHDELFVVFIRAIHIVNQSAVFLKYRKQFLIQEFDVLHLPLSVQQGVEEVNQQILVDFLPEDALETHIRKRINELSHIFPFYDS